MILKSNDPSDICPHSRAMLSRCQRRSRKSRKLRMPTATTSSTSPCSSNSFGSRHNLVTRWAQVGQVPDELLPVQSSKLGPETEAHAEAPSTSDVSSTAVSFRILRDMASS